jgi:hypothetical protein
MSLNGFITGPDEHGAGLGRGGEPLTYWFTKDPAESQLLNDTLFATAGAVVTSRAVYDGMNRWCPGPGIQAQRVGGARCSFRRRLDR